jgi:hypothetical protein
LFLTNCLRTPFVKLASWPTIEVGGARGFLMPSDVGCDELMAEPPLAHMLSESLVRSIRAPAVKAGKSVHLAAATHYGPSTQEKRCNEDFAISARFRDGDDLEWGVVAVADGVSTRTFWAARSSRIACLAAIETASEAIGSGPRPGNELDVDWLRDRLVQNLRTMFDLDHEVLCRHWAERRLTPSGWAQAVYEKNMNRREFWYNSTLLVAVTGPAATVLLHCGDGAVVVRKWEDGAEQPGLPNYILRSTENLEISTFVSRDVDSHQFKAVRIRHGANLSRLQVVLASDGTDRTAQLNAKTTADTVLESEFICEPAPDRREAERRLAHLLDSPIVEPDNHSIALMTWIRTERTSLDSPTLPKSSSSLHVPTIDDDEVAVPPHSDAEEPGLATADRSHPARQRPSRVHLERATHGRSSWRNFLRRAWRWFRIQGRIVTSALEQPFSRHNSGTSATRRPR